MNAHELIGGAFAACWSKPALVTDELSLTYAELFARAAGLRDRLAAQGCRPGDTVALRLPNGWPFAAAYLACFLGRFRAVPVNRELPQEDQCYILGRCGARVVLEDEAAASAPPAPAAEPAFDESAGATSVVFFTSGTTGRPKGVCHTWDALAGNVAAFNRTLGLDADTRLYHVLPMAYMAGFLNTLLSPWVAGGTVLLGPRFRPAEALDFWRRPLAWGANALWLTPTLAAALARLSRDPEAARRAGQRLRHLFCGTAPLPIATRVAFRAAFDCPLQESYGMSEVLLVSAQTREEAETACHVGRPLPEVRLDFRAVPEVGGQELVIHTPFALSGYWLEQGEASPLLADGGMPSGDLGRVENGALVIDGRLKDLIIRGGLNVSPAAVENALLRAPGVLEAAVVGVPHAFWGEAIVACIVPEPGADHNALQEGLRRRCATELGDGMRPDRYVWRTALPRSATGKVQKQRLAKELA